MHKIKHEPIAALMLRWAKNSSSVSEKDLLEHFDLSSADELHKKCDSICQWYNEFVLNSKYLTQKLISEELTNSNEKYLLIVLGAGRSLDTLESLNANSDNISKVLEIDTVGMDEKQQLYDLHFPHYSKKIKCITADIKSPTIREVLRNLIHEYYNNSPCIILFEDITYYLSNDELESIILTFKSKSEKNKNTLILESLLAKENADDKNTMIPYSILNQIKDYCKLPQVNPISSNYLSELIINNNGMLIQKSKMSDIEKMRIGHNKYFTESSEIGIECSAWKF
ncbi:MAG: class I SAM-dependent methyltransferase [Melioribacteraceae bacterium]|nr:class I SAM-dependent methyltransferase [Melioribacteraceae bacterium]